MRCKIIKPHVCKFPNKCIQEVSNAYGILVKNKVVNDYL